MRKFRDKIVPNFFLLLFIYFNVSNYFDPPDSPMTRWNLVYTSLAAAFLFSFIYLISSPYRCWQYTFSLFGLSCSASLVFDFGLVGPWIFAAVSFFGLPLFILSLLSKRYIPLPVSY